MNRWAVLLVGGCVLAGFGVGAVEAGKWLRILSAPGSPWIPAADMVRHAVWPAALAVVMGITAACYALLSRKSEPGRSGVTLAVAILSAGAGILACRTAIAVSGPFSFAPTSYLLVFAGALGLSVGLLDLVFTPLGLRDARSSARRGIVAALGWVILITFLRLFSAGLDAPSFAGFGIFASLAAPVEARVFPSLAADLAAGAVYGAFVGVAVAWSLRRGSRLSAAAWGAAAGAWISTVLYAAHLVTGTLIMQSAYSERVAWASSLLALPIAGGVVALGIISLTGGARRTYQRIAAGFIAGVLLVSAAALVVDSRGGSDLYLAALRARPYRTRVFIHFHGDGGWTRTLQPHADDVKIALCDRLLSNHARSIYAAEAAYLKAESRFDSWRFAECTDTLQCLKSRHPDSRGVDTLLLAQSYLVQGKFEALTSGFGRDDRVFANWRGRDGAQAVGRAYEITGRLGAARGLYTYYVSSLAGSRRGSWTPSAIAYAETRIDNLAAIEDRPAKRATVRGTVLLDGKPVQGVHIALVQPHLDAASPEDSRQFAGAKTIPLWFGIGVTTDEDGNFVMNRVPYDDYEVVIGFDAALIPADHVVSRTVGPVRVDSRSARIPDIRFIPGVRPIGPLGGVVTSLRPTLEWQPLPGAAYYSVSVVSKPNLGRAPMTAGPSQEGYTCWTASGIRGTSVRASPDGFTGEGSTEARTGSLVPGRAYTWMVFAYNEGNELISSSEHYRLGGEPVFVAQTDGSRGGFAK